MSKAAALTGLLQKETPDVPGVLQYAIEQKCVTPLLYREYLRRVYDLGLDKMVEVPQIAIIDKKGNTVDSTSRCYRCS